MKPRRSPREQYMAEKKKQENQEKKMFEDPDFIDKIKEDVECGKQKTLFE